MNNNNPGHQQTKNYYETLQVESTASLLDIKKAYRRLALRYHPDRNSDGEDTTQKFQEIGEAYECLSDDTKRSEYDAYLRGYRRPMMNTSDTNMPGAFGGNYRPSSGRPFFGGVDPFQQFDHLFRTDPFFQQGFQDLDDEFTKRFQSSHNSINTTHTGARTAQQHQQQQQQRHHTNNNKNDNNTNNNNNKEGWIPWILRQCGIQVQMTSYQSDGRGGMTASHYSSTNQTTKQSRTYLDDQGREVTIRQMQRGGNQIQDKLVSGRLVERRVNGQPVEVGMIEE